MLKLINIKINGDYIEADYVAEDGAKRGHVKLGIKNGSEEGECIGEYDGVYLRMSYVGLQKTLDEINAGKIKEPPQNRLVMWY